MLSGQHVRAQHGLGKVKQSGHKGKAGDGAVYDAAVAEQISEQTQQDQRNGQRIEEHQNRHGAGDDGAQAQIGDGERNHAENDGPGLVLRALGKSCTKVSAQLVTRPTEVFRQAMVTVAARIHTPASPK